MQTNPLIRPYSKKDQVLVLQILQLNTPLFFAPNEYEDFKSYLETSIEDYYILELNQQIIGAGGINYQVQEQTATISWDLLHPDFQRQGFGSHLLQHRLRVIKENDEIKQVIVRTSQIAYPFYQKHGFSLEYAKVNYWAPGYDLYYMSQEL